MDFFRILRLALLVFTRSLKLQESVTFSTKEKPEIYWSQSVVFLMIFYGLTLFLQLNFLLSGSRYEF